MTATKRPTLTLKLTRQPAAPAAPKRPAPAPVPPPKRPAAKAPPQRPAPAPAARKVLSTMPATERHQAMRAIKADARAIRARFGLPKDRVLAIGVGRLIRADPVTEGWTARRFKYAMKFITRHPEYIAAMAAPGAQRHDLNGNPVGPVAPEHAEWAVRRTRALARQKAARNT